MEAETIKLVVETGCEELSPYLDRISQSLGEIAPAASILASFALFAFILLAIAVTAAFGIMLISKLGVRDKVIMEAPKLISELFSCDFCLSWWTCLFLSIIASAVTGLWLILCVAVLATPLTRRLIV